MKSMSKSQGRFLTLLALHAGPQHGYEIAQYIEERSRGFFKLSYGNLYPILHRLEKDGLATSAEAEAQAGKRRRVYHLTKAGEQEVVREISGYELTVSALNQFIPEVSV